MVNDHSTSTSSKSARPPFKPESLYVDLGFTKTSTDNEIRIDEHFSLREYVSEMRKKNGSVCFPFASDGTDVNDLELQKLPPMHAPKFRWWSSENFTQESTGGDAANCSLSKARQMTLCIHSPSRLERNDIVRPDVPEHDKSNGRKVGAIEADKDHLESGSDDDIQEISRADFDLARNKKQSDLDKRDDAMEPRSFHGGGSSHWTFPRRRRKPRKMRSMADLLGLNGNRNPEDNPTTATTTTTTSDAPPTREGLLPTTATTATSDAPPTREGLLRSLSEKMARKIESMREKMDLHSNEKEQNGTCSSHGEEKPHEERISDDVMMEIAEIMVTRLQRSCSESENCNSNSKESAAGSSRLHQHDSQLVGVARAAQDQDIDRNPQRDHQYLVSSGAGEELQPRRRVRSSEGNQDE